MDRLLADRGTLVKLPELHRLGTSLLAAGLGDFLAEMRARRSEPIRVESYHYAWLHSILDHLASQRY